MKVTPVKTARITAGQLAIDGLVDQSIDQLTDGSVLAVTSKVVALCENRVAPIDSADKQDLIKRESELYLPADNSKYNISYTLTNHSLIPAAGIDESNGAGNYVLWPKDPLKSANELRRHLKQRFGLSKIGVVITDSTVRPLRYGTQGFAIAFSGFSPVNDYIGKPDLFGRPFQMSRSAVAEGLAAAAVLAMGEGAEQTPLAIIEDVSFVNFQDRDTTAQDLANFHITDYRDDLFGPFFEGVEWRKGDNGR